MSQTIGSSVAPAAGTPAPRVLDLMRIFCPRCGRLTMQANCDGCGWLRPTPDTPSRYLHIQGASVKLEGDVTVLDGHFVVTSAEGELFLVDRYDLKVRGAKILRMEGQVYHPTFTVAGDAERLYVGYNQSMQLGAGVSPVVAWSRPNLTEAWRCPTHGLKVSSPTLHAGVLYFAASNGEAWAVDAATGHVIWTRDVAGWSPEAPAVGGDVVIFPARGPEIAALRTQDGQCLWTWTSAAESDWYPATPTIWRDRVYLAGWNGALVCLDLATGAAVHPPYRVDRGQSFLTSPVVVPLHADDWLVVCPAKDRRLHAIDDAGKGRWTRPTGASVYGKPAVVEHELYFATRSERLLHAVDARTGLPIQERPLELEQGSKMAVTTDGVTVTVIGTRGAVLQVPRSLQPLYRPDHYVREQRLGLATVAAALADDPSTAADLCASHLDDPHAAAQLCLLASRPFDAAGHFAAAGRLAQAERLYAGNGHFVEAAAIARRDGRTLDAAKHLEKAEAWSDAAALYAELGQFAQAGAMYHRAGEDAAARRCFDQTGPSVQQAQYHAARLEWRAAAEQYRAANETVRAIECYRQAGDFITAAELWEEMGEFDHAAELWQAVRRYADVLRCQLQEKSEPALKAARTLARELGDHMSEARALAGLGLHDEAGAVLWELAREHERQTRGQDEVGLARLFKQAADYFEDAGQFPGDEQRRRCEEKQRYYSRRPDLHIVAAPSRRLRVGEVNKLPIVVTNRGRGRAAHVHIQLQPALDALDGNLTDVCAAIAPRNGRWEPALDIVPVKPGQVTLYCEITYRDQDGRDRTIKQSWQIEVQGPAETGTQIFHIHEGGHVVQSQGDVTIIHGDQLRDHAQKGDRVEINRGGGMGLTPDRCSGCGIELIPGAPFCDGCGKEVDGNGR